MFPHRPPPIPPPTFLPPSPAAAASAAASTCRRPSQVACRLSVAVKPVGGTRTAPGTGCARVPQTGPPGRRTSRGGPGNRGGGSGNRGLLEKHTLGGNDGHSSLVDNPTPLSSLRGGGSPLRQPSLPPHFQPLPPPTPPAPPSPHTSSPSLPPHLQPLFQSHYLQEGKRAVLQAPGSGLG